MTGKTTLFAILYGLLLCSAAFAPVATADIGGGAAVGGAVIQGLGEDLTDDDWDDLGPFEDTTAEYRSPFLEPFNEKMFAVNIWMDEHMLRPVARVYARAIPEPARLGVGRFFYNIGVAPRFANNLLQLKLGGAARVLGRFVINTTMGGLGFFDVADSWFELEKSDEDFGQTLGKYGVGPGAYLVLPFFGPSTIRDTVGRVADGFLDPKPYFLSGTDTFIIDTSTTAVTAVNERSLNLETFESIDRFALDLYSAVQDFYLQRREKEIAE